MDDLAAAGQVADVDRVAQIEVLDHGPQVVGVVVHVVPVADLGRAPLAAAVGGGDAVALVEEEQHLVVPVVRGERPTVAEDDRLTRAPVLVIDVAPSEVVTKGMARLLL